MGHHVIISRFALQPSMDVILNDIGCKCIRLILILIMRNKTDDAAKQ